MTNSRLLADRCPGVLRPWLAEDGALVRLRLTGGALSPTALRELSAIAVELGDGNLHLTGRANLQLRALPHQDGALDAALVARIAATGLLPVPSHELVRNIMVSPLTGLVGGRADLRPVAAALDAQLCADPVFATLAGRFLFVLDDGRGDLLDRPLDLGLVALGDGLAQLRIGSSAWGPVVPLASAAGELVALTRDFLAARDDDPAWHVDELNAPLGVPQERDERTVVEAAPPAYGPLAPGIAHVAVPDGVLSPDLVASLASAAALVVTPWRSVVTVSPTRPTRPTRRYEYVDDGAAIYLDSFATIRGEASFDHLPRDAEKVAVRMVHGTGQVDLVDDLVIHPLLVSAARSALEAGAPILTDAHMVASGVTRARLPRTNEVVCLLRDERVPGLAAAMGTTRSAAALSLWGPRLEGAVVAIGNAPTALFHLLELLIDGGPRPAAIIGCPVGFIGAAESKQALASLAEDHGIDIPFLTVRGRRGGSAMTASALNAIAQEQE
ncbi:Precorrin-8X methylmutase (modular protein) [metagenome]|uniref:Precorrin-8X methylmutase (Modular protein) n=1 Tax=metagenome TaxID=256318 RepID=A0A2P2C4S3_9ZZZZ